MFYMWGLRDSRLLDLEAVFGSKSDTPTRAKNWDASYSNGQEKTRKTEVGRLRQNYAGPRRTEIRTSEAQSSMITGKEEGILLR